MVEQHRAHADQAVIADGAAVQHDHVADGDALADADDDAAIGVDDGPVLDIAVFADDNLVRIAAYRAVPPDGRIFCHLHVGHDDSVGGDPAFRIKGRGKIAKSVGGHNVSSSRAVT